VSISSAVWAQYTNVTDRQTDHGTVTLTSIACQWSRLKTVKNCHLLSETSAAQNSISSVATITAMFDLLSVCTYRTALTFTIQLMCLFTCKQWPAVRLVRRQAVKPAWRQPHSASDRRSWNNLLQQQNITDDQTDTSPDPSKLSDASHSWSSVRWWGPVTDYSGMAQISLQDQWKRITQALRVNISMWAHDDREHLGFMEKLMPDGG